MCILINHTAKSYTTINKINRQNNKNQLNSNTIQIQNKTGERFTIQRLIMWIIEIKYNEITHWFKKKVVKNKYHKDEL